LRSKYVVGLILAATMMATLVPFSAMVYAEDQEKEKAEEKAAEFLALAEQSKEQVKILIETVEAQEDIEVPEEALTLNKTGSELLEQAWTAFNEERYEEAIDLVEEALENFKEAIKVLNKALEPVEEIKTESEHSALGEAINRAYERIARIKDANNTYFSMYAWDATIGGWILSNLTAAETNLKEAEEALDIPNVGWAAGNLTEANHNISDAFAALRELGSWTNAWRIESFLRGIKNSYERTLELLKKREVTPDSTIVGYIEGNITEARDHMIAAMQKWNDGDKDSAKTERREAIEYLRVVRDLLRQLRPGGSKKGFD